MMPIAKNNGYANQNAVILTSEDQSDFWNDGFGATRLSGAWQVGGLEGSGDYNYMENKDKQ